MDTQRYKTYKVSYTSRSQMPSRVLDVVDQYVTYSLSGGTLRASIPHRVYNVNHVEHCSAFGRKGVSKANPMTVSFDDSWESDYMGLHDYGYDYEFSMACDMELAWYDDVWWMVGGSSALTPHTPLVFNIG